MAVPDTWPDDDDLMRDAYHALGGSGVAYIAQRDNLSS
jgi:hypothetical protein